MKKRLLFLLFALPMMAMGQIAETQTREELKLIDKLYYERDSYIASDDERDKLKELVFEMRADSTLKIHVIGYGDKWGGKEVNDRFSYIRAKYIGDWIRSCRVPREQIAYVGAGIDSLATNEDEARRVEVSQVITVVVPPAPQPKVEEPKVEVKKEEIIEVKEVVQSKKEEVVVEPKKVEVVETADQVRSNVEEVTEVKPTPVRHSELDSESQTEQNYYLGAGIGTSVGWSSFSGAGVKAQIFGGVEFSDIISAELSLGYSSLNMKSSQCCENLYYVDGKRVFAPVAGKKSYRYGDITSKVSLLHLTAKANFDLVSIWCKDSRWSGLVSPKIGYIHSSANLDDITKESSSHFSAGADLSGGYNFNDNWGVRLTTGFEYLTGKGIDGLPQCEHTSNTLWSTTINVIYKF